MIDLNKFFLETVLTKNQLVIMDVYLMTPNTRNKFKDLSISLVFSHIQIQCKVSEISTLVDDTF